MDSVYNCRVVCMSAHTYIRYIQYLPQDLLGRYSTAVQYILCRNVLQAQILKISTNIALSAILLLLLRILRILRNYRIFIFGSTVNSKIKFNNKSKLTA